MPTTPPDFTPKGVCSPPFVRLNLDAPAQKLTALALASDWTPADGVYARSIYCNAAGTIKVLMAGEQADDSLAVTIKVVLGNNPISVRKVFVTGTDAALILAGIFAGF